MHHIQSFLQSLKWSKEEKKISNRDKCLLVVLLGLLLLVVVWPVNKKEHAEMSVKYEKEMANDVKEAYEEKEEERLKNILGNIDGVGNVQVMITLKSSAEQIVEKDKSYSESRQSEASSVTRSESTIYSDASEKTPYIVKEVKPEVEGILVVAEGGDKEEIINEITYAVQALFDVPVHKIKVVKMSHQ